MTRKIFLMLFAFGFILAVSALSFAQGTDKPAAQENKAVNVGNKICPVTGEKIDEKTKVTYEYKGKIYNFCCAACPDEFKKDPEKYIKKVDEELNTGTKPEVKTQNPSMPMDMPMGHQH